MKFTSKPEDFSRERRLNLENTIGGIMHMVLNRNKNGYDITMQNYFSELSNYLGKSVGPVSRQAFSKAKGKISYKAFEYLLNKANQEESHAYQSLKWRGHNVRAIDGVNLRIPNSKDILKEFPQKINNKKYVVHYPAANVVTATNVFTGQVMRAEVFNMYGSERSALIEILKTFKPGDVCLLDRGFEGFAVMAKMIGLKQNFILRVKKKSKYAKEFLKSGKRFQVVGIIGKTYEGEVKEIKIKLVLVHSKKRDNEPVIVATSLLEYSHKDISGLYKRRWVTETLYHRVKCLLDVEKFHAQTAAGVLQEIYANLLVLSLTALVVNATSEQFKLRPTVIPNFKNATDVFKRHLFDCINIKEGNISTEVIRNIIEQTAKVLWTQQPGRKHVRVSKTPPSKWSVNRGRRRKGGYKWWRQKKVA